NAVAVDALTRDAIQTFGNIQSLDLQDGAAASGHLEYLANVSINLLGKFVTMALDVEEDFLVHQIRLEESNDAIAVGVIADIVRGLQFNQRHTAPGLFVND